jgi:plastocyanin
MRAALIAGVVLALGAAAPAFAADVTIKNFAFTPDTITVAQGDTVTWHYAGPDTNHSVTSDPGQADSWDSDPSGPPSSVTHPPGSVFSRMFNTPGTFTYFCKVHSNMHGKVVVTGPGGAPPPDTTPPVLSSVKATGGRTCKRGAQHCTPKPTVVHFTLSEDATVKVAVPGHPKANQTKSAKAGSDVAVISTRRLPPGKYRVNVTATDAAGNSSATAHATVRVRKG